MMPGPIAGSVAILAKPRERGTALYGLTNFSAETIPPAFARLEFLRWLRGVVVSGDVKATKPDPRIFTRCSIPKRSSRIALSSSTTWRPTPTPRPRSAFTAFTAPDALRAELAALELLP